MRHILDDSVYPAYVDQIAFSMTIPKPVIILEFPSPFQKKSLTFRPLTFKRLKFGDPINCVVKKGKLKDLGFSFRPWWLQINFEISCFTE